VLSVTAAWLELLPACHRLDWLWFRLESTKPGSFGQTDQVVAVAKFALTMCQFSAVGAAAALNYVKCQTVYTDR
jgi:hypothetical protein